MLANEEIGRVLLKDLESNFDYFMVELLIISIPRIVEHFYLLLITMIV